MGSNWTIVWVCLCALLVTGQSAVVPNKEALVIGKPSYNPQTIEEAVQQSTEAPLPRIDVKELQVKCKISLRYAHTTFISLVSNPAPKPQQYRFEVLLPDTAFISGFQMTVDGKTYKAYVKEKEEAKQIYNAAVSQGLSAAHVATTARDSNRFGLDINIQPQQTILFNMTYEELLIRRNGLYKNSINMNPGTTIPRLSVEVHIKESQKINKLRVPEITTGNEIIPTDTDAQNTKAVITRAADDREAKITFTPDIVLQKVLLDIFAQKANESAASSHKQFYFDGNEESKPEGMGQFVVQYDVERPKNSEILVSDGYFVHFLAPSDLPPMAKHCVIVLDTSGSMSGRKIEQLRTAMMKILSDLRSVDFFSLIDFASGVKVLNIDDADKPAPPKPSHYVFYDREQTTKLVPPYKATPENIAKAKTLVERLTAQGGTNIAGALNAALDLIHKGVNWKEEVSNKTVTELVTETEAPTTEACQNNKESKAMKPKPEHDVKNELNSYQPIIIFLTDGEPTVGETNPKRIASNVVEKNVGERAASIFSLAFGNGADRNFLQKLSLQNRGYMRHIYEASDATLQMYEYYKTFAVPLIENMSFTYPPNQVKKTTKTKFRTYFEGTEMIVAGKINPSATEITPIVSGFCGVEDGLGKKRYEVRPKGLVPKKQTEDEYFPMERIFGYLTIKQLLEQIDAAEYEDKNKEVKEKLTAEILDISLKYSFVTPVSSLVVVTPNNTNTVNPEPLDGIKSSPQYASGSSQLLAANFAPLAFKADFSSAIGQVQWESQQQYLPESLYESEDDIDDVDYDAIAPSSSTADHHPTPAHPITPSNTLNTFHLDNYTWSLSLLDLNTGEFRLQDNGVSTILKLTKDFNVSQSLSPCSRAINGAPGDCMYLTLCKAAQNITADQYMSTFCTIDGGYAGVCCPKEIISEPALQNEPTEPECDAESNDQSDIVDKTSDDAESQNEDITNTDTDSNTSTDVSDTPNDQGEIFNDEEKTPQDDAITDDDTDPDDKSTVETNPEEIDFGDSIDDNTTLTEEETVTQCNDDLDQQQEQIMNDGS